MAARLEDYALLGDLHTAALVDKTGSIDWLCLPRFDSGACFAALLGTPDHGRWQIAPRGSVRQVRRRYRPGTLVLETDFVTDDGVVRLIDCMPPRSVAPDVVRMVVGLEGRVPMSMQLVIRFDYGSIVPWVRRLDGTLLAIAGPDALLLKTPLETKGENMTTVADFTLSAGQQIPFVLTWYPSHESQPPDTDAKEAIELTDQWWREWSSRFVCESPYREPVLRSLITLKALTFAPTGGIAAAPTTSLPEQIGGVRNWDYRFCWLRDATFTLQALGNSGYMEEAVAWRNWLLRAVAGSPDQLQILYGLGGERRIAERQLDWLPGYESSRPVRIGNAAAEQFQLDVYGEVLDMMHQSRRADMEVDEANWSFERALLDFLHEAWRRPDEGIWEIRGPRQHFVHSKVMAWVAFDRAIKAVERFHLSGPVELWKQTRQEIHRQVCEHGFNRQLNSFVQHYGTQALDASLLIVPLVGFLPPDDPRVRGTIAAVERTLMKDGLVARYLTRSGVDGLPPGEGAFLPCSFWLADALALTGRREEAKELFQRLLDLRNDVGLLAEEYDPLLRRQVGNFPQAFSHVGLINTAHGLWRSENAVMRHET